MHCRSSSQYPVRKEILTVTGNMNECSRPIQSQDLPTDAGSILDEGLESCVQECNYDVKSPPKAVLEELSRWETNIIVLEIGFSDMEVTKYLQRRSMTAITLLSNLGGSIGLWLGASLFAVIQLNIFICR